MAKKGERCVANPEAEEALEDEEALGGEDL